MTKRSGSCAIARPFDVSVDSKQKVWPPVMVNVTLAGAADGITPEYLNVPGNDCSPIDVPTG